MNKSTTKKLTTTCILTALATLTYMLESLFPPLIIPGARMGLSNLFVLIACILIGYKQAFIVLIVKCVIGSLYSGNISTLLYSLPAGIISLSVQAILFAKLKKVSVLSVSVFGAVVNSSVQNLTFCIITKTHQYLIYLPYLALIAIVSGLIVGYTTYLLIKKLPSKLFKFTSEQ